MVRNIVMVGLLRRHRLPLEADSEHWWTVQGLCPRSEADARARGHQETAGDWEDIPPLRTNSRPCERRPSDKRGTSVALSEGMTPSIEPRIQPLHTPATDSGRLVAHISDLMRAEYVELPGLCLTLPQAMRLWSLDEDLCRKGLALLQKEGFLEQCEDGMFRAVTHV
jgi:hypothetical protein